MASTSISSSAVYYPYPSGVNVVDFVPLKLCPTNYSVWKQLMLNLIESHELEGFVDGTIQPPPFPLEEQKQEEYRSWKRSDGLVRAWVFVMVTEEILPLLVPWATAREAWFALEQMLSPPSPSLPQSIAEPEPEIEAEPEPESEDERQKMIASRYLPLYKAILNGDWENANRFFEQEPTAVRDDITLFSETALMVAVRSSKRNEFVKNLMERMLPEDVAWQGKTGQTALYRAVVSGNKVAAKLLVKKNPELPNIGARQEGTPIPPVHNAAHQGNREMVEYLLELTKPNGDPNPFEGKLGVTLLNNLVKGELYDIASTFLQCYPMLASMKPSPLMEISYRLTSFHSGTRLNCFQRLIYFVIPLKFEGNTNKSARRDVENPAEGVISTSEGVSISEGVVSTSEGVVSTLGCQKLHAMFWDVAEKLVPPIKSVRETKLIHHQALKFVKHLCEEVVKSEHSKAMDIFCDPLLNAATSGTCEIVEEILEVFPCGIYFTNQREQTIFQLAIENRQENVFNLLYQLDENQDWFLAVVDKFKNNSLHVAGNFSSQQQLSLQANVAGAALQMQRELQWFKAIEKLLPPNFRYSRNDVGKTAQDIFTKTHKELVKEGEKWMKDTASSCTIVAALIVTVVFAAAITVPGGINDNGLPIFMENRAFVLFSVFDALALFSSTASLLIFLSIFTSRFGEHDFLYSLPRKLIIGMVTLFLSIISMMIAFGATLKMVFGYKRAWVVIPVVVLSSVPITLFALLQFPLLLDMIRSTYYPGIFGKRSNRILY